MRAGLPWLLGAWIIAAAPVFAQAPPAVVAPSSAVPVDLGVPPPPPDLFRFWARAEYLSYWVKNTPVPISLTTGDPGNPTQELLNTDRDLGMFSGVRIGFGTWLDSCNNVGLEMSAFSLQRRTRHFEVSSDDAGSPALAFPFVSQAPGAVGNMFMPITSPGLFAGNVVVGSSLQLWGAEANGTVSVVRQGGFELVGLVGFRYVNLHENLNIDTLSSVLVTNPNTVLFQSDEFNTKNQFYGGQIGGRLTWQSEWYGVDLTGKLAIGGTQQTVNIQGYSSQTGPGGVNGVFPGGFFTQPSNIGRFNANQFAVIPAVELKLWVLLTSHVRAFAGYDFLYWNQVLRPGNQVDRNINLTQSAVFGNGALNGPANPTPLYSRSDFWAQGVTLGIEFGF